DTFQVGQLVKADRSQFGVMTVETTRGFLSNGISHPTTINGGVGDDTFVVFRNKAVLQLNGNAGDDTFVVRAFALKGSTEPDQDTTDISAGEGRDPVLYAANAPVNIDGGDGFDTVTVIGTEFNDNFVLTANGVFGAGLNVNFAGVESLTVDGAEGNDHFYIMGTNPALATTIVGNLGSDSFDIGGDPVPVVSNDLRGHDGLLTHTIGTGDATRDTSFDGVSIPGLSVHVADNDEPAVVLTPTGGVTRVGEGGGFDSYTVVLTRPPRPRLKNEAADPVVVITLSAD